MKTKTSFLKSTLVTLAAALGLSGPVGAAHLDAPDDLTCGNGGDLIYSSWSVVDGASEYAVDVTADYDVNGSVRSQNFRFGASDPRLDLFKSDLEAKFYDDNEGVVTGKAKAVRMRVKALHVGKGHEIGKGHEKGRGQGHETGHMNQASSYSNECQVALSECRFLRGC